MSGLTFSIAVVYYVLEQTEDEEIQVHVRTFCGYLSLTSALS